VKKRPHSKHHIYHISFVHVISKQIETGKPAKGEVPLKIVTSPTHC
jgi:hypothetical protein